jgi:hypothetical protein
MDSFSSGIRIQPTGDYFSASRAQATTSVEFAVMMRLQSEPALITHRRHFLRAFGLTVAGATLPIPLLLADTPEQRIKLQLAELTRALQQLYPESVLYASFRRRPPHEAGFNPVNGGEIIAIVKAAGPT